MDLTTGLKPGIGVTTDNFFTSLDLAKELAKRKLMLTGTLQKNRVEIL